jgi:hypothetical protein
MTTPVLPTPERHVFEFAKYAMSIGWQDLAPTPLWRAYSSWASRFGPLHPTDSLGKWKLPWEEFNSIYSRIRFNEAPKVVSLKTDGNLYRSTVE